MVPCLLVVCLLLLLSDSGPVHGEVVGAVVMPHGGIALDPTHFKTSSKQAMSEAWSLHNACKEAGALLGSWKPDILLLSTPHGVADLTQFSFYLNSKAVGANVSGMVGYGDAEPFPLRWGEVIPLHFLLPSLPDTTLSLVLSQPNRRYTQSVEMVPELLALGAGLYSILEPLKERVAIVISADLAHTHLASGPYGYSNASEPFDESVGTWASTLNSTSLLVSAASFVDRALSCGYTGLVMLHGILQARGLETWKPTLYSIHHPSYYGMMVAAFPEL